jgi:hypothetical protein
MTLDQRLALERGQRFAALVRAVVPHAQHVAAIGVAEALDDRYVLTEMRFKPL